MKKLVLSVLSLLFAVQAFGYDSNSQVMSTEDIQQIQNSSYNLMSTTRGQNTADEYFNYLGFETEKFQSTNDLYPLTSEVFATAKQYVETSMFSQLLDPSSSQVNSVELVRKTIKNFRETQNGYANQYITNINILKAELKSNNCTVEELPFVDMFSPKSNDPFFDEMTEGESDGYNNDYDTDKLILKNMIRSTTYYVATKLVLNQSIYNVLDGAKQRCIANGGYASVVVDSPESISGNSSSGSSSNITAQ